MSVVAEKSPPSRSFLDGYTAGAGCALLAGLLVALVDVVATSSGSAGSGAAVTVFGLWAPIIIGFSMFAGVMGAELSAFGPRPFGRLRENPEADATLAAAIVAGALMLVVLATILGPPLNILVVKAKRASAGAHLMKVVVVLGIIALATAAVPLWRLVRLIVRQLPAAGPLPRTAWISIVIGVVVLWWSRRVLYTAGFETQALPIGALTLLVLLPVLTIVVAALFYGPLAGVRTRIPVRALLVRLAYIPPAVVFALTFTGQPSAKVAESVANKGMVSRLLVTVGQTVLDGDGDGYSAFFRGPDCDDGNKNVHPGATDIVGNGIDENCAFGDAKPGSGAAVTPPLPAPAMCPCPDGGGTAAAPTGPKQNVLIIMVDTLRVDRFGASGYQRDGQGLTPRMDQFLAASTWFKHTYAQANNTPRSMPSFMTSRYPSLVKVDKIFSKYPRVDDANEMLFERLQAGGWHTVGIASHFYFRDERNFTQGFDEFDNDGALDIGPSNKDTAAPRIVPKVEAKLAALKQGGKPFAMFVHLFEPHSSWMEHEGNPPITEKGTKAHAQRYDYEIKFVDQWVGKIFDALDKEGLADNTVVVLMSDHGESFGEHSFAGESMFHGTNLYDEQLRVPFAFRVPGQKGKAVDNVVQLIDLAPTVVELAGGTPAPSWLGRSLAPAIRGETLPPVPAFAELLAYPGWQHDLKMAIAGDGSHKLIHVISQQRFELYDLAADPGEKRDLYGQGDAKVAQDKMGALMAQFVDVVLSQPQPQP